MVPISFDNLTRVAGIDALNAFPVTETARATHESFETHLQLATTNALEQSTHATPPREDRRDEIEPRPRSESLRRDSVQQESQERRHDDVDVRQEEVQEAARTDESSRLDQEQNEDHDTVVEDEVVVTSGLEEQRALVQQIEVDAVDEANQGVKNQSNVADANALPSDATDHQADAQAEEDSAILSALNESQTTEEQARADSSTKNDAQRERLDQLAAKETAGKSTAIDDGNTNAGAATELSKDVTAAQAEEAGKLAAAITPRGAHRAEVGPTETTGTANEVVAKSIETALAGSASEDQSAGDTNRRNPQQNAQAAPAVTGTSQSDSSQQGIGVPSRFAQHLLQRTAEPNARGLNITDVDQSRFIDRVARAVQANGERGGTIRLRLSPPELGSMSIEIKVQNGAVSARVEADTPPARTLLLENLPVLRERLAEQGMRVDQFDVDLMDRHTGGTPDDLQQNDQRQRDRPRSEPTTREAEEVPQTDGQKQTTDTGNQQLNIIV